MAKTPVFDIGETLVPIVRFYNEVVDEETYDAELEVGNFNIFDPESSESYFAEKDVEVDGEKLKENYIRKVKQFMKSSGRLEMLKQCSEEFGPIGIISDNWTYSYKMYKEMFNKHGVEFKGLIISEKVGATKPDQRIFRAFLNKRDREAESFVYFGNHAERDKAAKDAGMSFVFTTEYDNFGTSYDGRSVSELSFENVKQEVEN